MRKLFLTIALFLSTLILCAQETKHETIVIGIGNANEQVYTQIKTFLSNTHGIKIKRYCDSQRVLELSLDIKTYKSSDEVFEYIYKEFNDALLFVKSKNILDKDCSDEILKQ